MGTYGGNDELGSMEENWEFCGGISTGPCKLLKIKNIHCAHNRGFVGKMAIQLQAKYLSLLPNA